MDAADFYTGIVVEGYSLLKQADFPADRYAELIDAWVSDRVNEQPSEEALAARRG